MYFKLLIWFSICYFNNFYVNSAVLKHESKENASNVCVTQDCIETAALISNSMDDTVDPCDDFYKYACGNWQKEHFVPPNASYIYSHFSKLSRQIRGFFNSKFEKGYQPDDSPVIKRIFNFYNSCLDIESRNKVGLKHLKELINSVGGWSMIDTNWNSDNFHWEDAYVKVSQLIGSRFPFALIVIGDVTNPSHNILWFKSPYTTIRPDFEVDGIITENDPIKMIRKFNIFESQSDNENITEDINGSPLNHTEWARLTSKANLNFDKIRNITLKIKINETYQEYVTKNYDKVMWSVDKLKKLTPDINWDKIFMGLFGRRNITEKVLVLDEYFANHINDVVKELDKSAMAHHFALALARGMVAFTTEKYLKQFTFTKDLKTECFEEAFSFSPDLISKLYLDHINFDKNKRIDVQNMVQLVRSSFEQLLETNTWMDPVTKKLAKEKLSAIEPHVAAPDIVFDEKSLEKDNSEFGNLNDDYFINQVKAFIFSNRKVHYNLGLQNKAIWPPGLDYAHIVNAFYHPLYNGIYLPAGITQIPFYGLNRPISSNLGSLGIVIGHELTHGFDNQGSRYDLNGVYKNWWTNETLEKFQTKNQCFVKQYSRFNVTEINKFVDGNRTLGENIADNGGMREAFYALQNYKKLHGAIDKLPGDLSKLSDEKIFFLSFANQWCENNDKKSAMYQLYDVHSPAHARVVLSLANFDEFAKTYNCPVNSRMNPKDKCIVW